MPIKESICCHHNDIKMFATKIKKMDITKYPTPEDCIDLMRDYASEIIELSKKAKVAGCHMENRLQLYREAIENLGFVRKKRKKYERK